MDSGRRRGRRRKEIASRNATPLLPGQSLKHMHTECFPPTVTERFLPWKPNNFTHSLFCIPSDNPALCGEGHRDEAGLAEGTETRGLPVARLGARRGGLTGAGNPGARVAACAPPSRPATPPGGSFAKNEWASSWRDELFCLSSAGSKSPFQINCYSYS